MVFSLQIGDIGTNNLVRSTSGLRDSEKSEPLDAPDELENNSQTSEEKNGCDNIAVSSDVSSEPLDPENITRFSVADESLPNEITVGNNTRDEVCELPLNGEDASFKEPPSQSIPEEVGNQQNTKY